MCVICMHIFMYTSQAIYAHLPCQRQLSAEVRHEAEGLLKLKVNKKLLQQHLTVETGKVMQHMLYTSVRAIV